MGEEPATTTHTPGLDHVGDIVVVVIYFVLVLGVGLWVGVVFFSFFLRSSIGGGGVLCDRFFNSSATWAATFRLRGYNCMLVIFVLP